MQLKKRKNNMYSVIDVLILFLGVRLIMVIASVIDKKAGIELYSIMLTAFILTLHRYNFI